MKKTDSKQCAGDTAMSQMDVFALSESNNIKGCVCVNDRAKQDHTFLMANCDKYSEGMMLYKVTE